MKLLSFLTALLLSFPNSLASRQATSSPSASSTQAAATPQRDPQALGILAQSLNAAGGAPALTAIEDFTATGNITYYWAGQAVPGGVTIRGRGTVEFRLDASLSAGNRSWAVSPVGASIKDTDGTLSPIPSVNTRNLGALSFPQLKLAAISNSSAFTVQYGGLTDVGGRQTHVIHIQQFYTKPDDPDGFLSHLTATDVLIDAQSYQVVIIRDAIHPPNHTSVDLTHEIDFSDYRLSNACLVPFSITEKVDGQQTWTVQLSAISFNAGLTDADFEL
jgi:hypothetical protein